jgi:hypothetical protein
MMIVNLVLYNLSSSSTQNRLQNLHCILCLAFIICSNKTNEIICLHHIRVNWCFWTQCLAHLVFSLLSLSLSQNIHSSFFTFNTYFWSWSNLLSNYRFAFHTFVVRRRQKVFRFKGWYTFLLLSRVYIKSFWSRYGNELCRAKERSN